MFKKKEEKQKSKPQQIEEIKDEEDYEMQDEPKLKKREPSTEQIKSSKDDELTEEAVKQILTNLSYRIGRIEHYLRLDY
jgi:rRNA maturation endonuclease Nob1